MSTAAAPAPGRCARLCEYIKENKFKISFTIFILASISFIFGAYGSDNWAYYTTKCGSEECTSIFASNYFGLRYKNDVLKATYYDSYKKVCGSALAESSLCNRFDKVVQAGQAVVGIGVIAFILWFVACITLLTGFVKEENKYHFFGCGFLTLSGALFIIAPSVHRAIADFGSSEISGPSFVLSILGGCLMFVIAVMHLINIARSGNRSSSGRSPKLAMGKRKSAVPPPPVMGAGSSV
eukprot:GILI01013911.1.p1 GENE.GILI01013911.1~~GILI01013911.1.p1  ORF type:complete len:247 (+),score=51.17 GILI01013911.1:30-743(+)